jgi:hypothetical protein
VLEQAALSKVRDARNRDRESIDYWIRTEKGGDKFLSGCEARPWMSDSQRDLLSLSSGTSEDLFTRWIEEHVLRWMHWLIFYPWKVRFQRDHYCSRSEY